jgi:hypothetical protein
MAGKEVGSFDRGTRCTILKCSEQGSFAYLALMGQISELPPRRGPYLASLSP